MQQQGPGIGHNGPPPEALCPPSLMSEEARIVQRHRPVGLSDRGDDARRVKPASGRTRGGEPAAEEALGAILWLNSRRTADGRRDPAGGPDLERALVNPGAVFASPDEVVSHPLLSHRCKRAILWRWAWDAYLIEVAQDEGMPEGPPSRLDEVRTALRRLGDEWRPHPAAPAAFAIRLQVPDNALAA